MPSIVNEILSKELEEQFTRAGSCLVISFNKLTVKQASDLRNQFRESGVLYKVVKNRLATRAFQSALGLDMSEAFTGKCGVVLADEEKAISAAKLIRDSMRKLRARVPPLVVTGAVIEGQAITGAAASTIADMPDRNTVNAMLASAISGPARALATVIGAVPSGIARALQAKIDKEAG